jgi:hypothetical protein
MSEGRSKLPAPSILHLLRLSVAGLLQQTHLKPAYPKQAYPKQADSGMFGNLPPPLTAQLKKSRGNLIY